MKNYNLAFLGFGNVGQALARLLLRKRDELQTQYKLTFIVTGIATGRHGMAIDLVELTWNTPLSFCQPGDRWTGFRPCRASPA